MTKDYREDERVVSAFVRHARVVDIAKSAHLAKGTVYELKKDRAFMKVVQERRDSIFAEAVMRMSGFLCEDVALLQELIRDPSTPPATRINGIRTLSDMLMSWRAQTELQDRIMALEDAQGPN